MKSVLEQIKLLRNDEQMDFLTNYYNRYMLVIQEPGRIKTAYCFSVPIYSDLTDAIVDLRFQHSRTSSTHIGSSSKISIADSAYFKNQYGTCNISLPGKIVKKTQNMIVIPSSDGYMEVQPTLNGLLFKVPCEYKHTFTVRIKLEHPFESVRSNNKYFAIMREKFIPFITVSCIGTLNEKGDIIAPCEISFEQNNASEYSLTLESKSNFRKYIAYEINLHESKLFQDTTVESKHPRMNNAFGGMAFLGETEDFGEQWLYSRLELTNLPQLQTKKIVRSVWHIPMLNPHDDLLTLNRITARFCSFGSNWENKIAITDPLAESTVSNGYHHLDITGLIGDIKRKSENFVIRAKTPKGKPVVIPTGDSFYQPHILEVKFYL